MADALTFDRARARALASEVRTKDAGTATTRDLATLLGEALELLTDAETARAVAENRCLGLMDDLRAWRQDQAERQTALSTLAHRNDVDLARYRDALGLIARTEPPWPYRSAVLPLVTLARKALDGPQ